MVGRDTAWLFKTKFLWGRGHRAWEEINRWRWLDCKADCAIRVDRQEPGHSEGSGMRGVAEVGIQVLDPKRREHLRGGKI